MIRNRVLMIGLGAAGFSALICIGSVATAHAEEAEMAFTKMDKNGDGKISVEEWTDGHKAIYEKMDTNGDGKVTSDEIAVMQEKKEKMGKGGKPMMAPTEMVKMMDTNGDGVVSEEEFVAGSKVMFDKIDVDHDGYLTKAELKAGHQKMMDKKQTKMQERMQEKGEEKGSEKAPQQ